MQQLMNYGEQPERKSTHAQVAEIKATGQDFEWYPTTDEILDAVKADMHECLDVDGYGQVSVLDCGAGDGRALMHLTECKRYAIEKSMPLIAQMDRSIIVLGTDFHQNTLIDKRVDVVFCNPPYSEYDTWMRKVVREANAGVLYFVVPNRWKNDASIAKAIEQRRADSKIIGSFDFSTADRKARASVDIVRVGLAAPSYNDKDQFRRNYDGVDARTDPFKLWFDDFFKIEIASSGCRFGFHEKNNLSDAVQNSLVSGGDLIEALAAIYQKDLEKLLATYKKIEDISPVVLGELDIDLGSLRDAVRQRVEGLKDLYWNELFDNLGKITSRLTSGSRKHMLSHLTAHTHIDFSVDNAIAVLYWVIQNANSYFDDQLITVVEDMVSTASCQLYKSNHAVYEDKNWYYLKDTMDHYGLDRRIVMHRHGGICVSEFAYRRDAMNGLVDNAFHFINDLLTIAHNLGFDTSNSGNAGEHEWESNKRVVFDYYHHTEDRWIELFSVRAFKNGNMHFKFNQRFIMMLNVEFGRLKGWLGSAEEAADELDIPIETARESFRSNVKLDHTALNQLTRQ